MNIVMRWQTGAERVADLHRRQPLLTVVVLLLAGMLCGYRLGLVPLALAVASACAAWSAWGPGAGRWAARAGLVLMLGWGRGAWDAAGRREEAARLKGAASEAFVCRVGQEVAKGGDRYTFRAERVNGASCGAVRRLPVTVHWFVNGQTQARAPEPGEVWRVVGRPRVWRGRNGQLSVTLNTGSERSERVAAADEGSWLVRLAHARREAARRVTVGIEDWELTPLSGEPRKAASSNRIGVVPMLNQAMMLGCRSEIPPEMRRVFTQSGTIHVFAISGLNIALVAGLLIVAVSALGVPRPYWVLGVAPLLVFYTLASGAQPSAVRACVMAILYFAAPLFGRRPDGVSALTATALAVYAWSPHLIFNIGCTLSFAVMGGLVVFCKPFCEWGRRLVRVPLVEQRARLCEQAGNRAAAARSRWLAAALRFLVDNVSVSLAAWLASLPLSAYYFGRFTPGGLFANLVISPCAFLVMVAGSLGLAASAVSAWAASCFNHAAGLFTVAMVRTAEVTVGFRWASFEIARWEPWMVWAWFLALALGAVWLRQRRPDGMAWLAGESAKDGL